MRLHDLWRPKAPPKDERPADAFPQVFVTPRALADIRAAEKHRGRSLVIYLEPRPGAGFAALFTPYGNLKHPAAARVSCPEVPAYINHGHQQDRAIFLIDNPPLPNDPPGHRTPNHPRLVTLPYPGGAVASDPGLLRLSFPKLQRLHPEVLLDAAAHSALVPVATIAYQLLFGDANPALVAAVTSDALLVSAFSPDIDTVVLLRFPPGFAADYNLKPGSRLCTLNSYDDKEEMAPDLTPGPDYTAWTNFRPYIAEFLTDDPQRLAQLHAALPDHNWQKCREMTVAALKKRPLTPRDGRPLRSMKPAGSV